MVSPSWVRFAPATSLDSRPQRHLEELDRLGREYRETLERDAQEREIWVQVQRENAATLMETLRRR